MIIRFRIFIGALVLFFIPFYSFSQIQISGVAGVSYIEHLSVGFRFQLGPKHALSTLYGSNFFINNNNFRNLIFQYDYTLNKLSRKKLTPRLGLRGEDSYFTDSYYRWHVMNIIPFIGTRYQYDEKIDFFVEAGVSIAFLQSVERIKLGDVGIYKQYLPEVKIGIAYKLYEKSK